MFGSAANSQSDEVGMKPTPSTSGRQDGHDNSASVAGEHEPPPESRMNKIARRAHEIYAARGGEHGKAMEDWLQAEREVDAEIHA